MSVRVPAIEKKADENIRKWTQAAESQQQLSKDEIKKNVGPYIALARETGAGGSALASKIAQRLQWDLLDKEIVDYMVEHYGTPRSLVELVDEKHSNWLGEIVTSWIGGLGFSESTYTHRLGQLFLLAASHGNVVIVGRGARFFLPSDRGLSVRILAPLDFRIEQIVLRRGITEKEARQFVIESDRQRETYVKEHFHRKAADPHLYDLVINVEKLGQDAVADLIVDAAQGWMEKSGVKVFA